MSNLKSSCLRWVVVFVACTVAANGSITKDEVPAKAPDSQELNKVKGYEYLKKYGYLSKRPTKDDASGMIPPDKAVKAIKNLQKFAGLSETGEIDADTLELIERPRCGVKDPVISNDTVGVNASESGERRRRYVVAGPPYQWDKNDLTYMVVNYPGPPSTITADEVDADVRRAFKLWSDATPLTFRSVDDENEADIRLIFGKRSHTDVEGDPPFDGPGGTLAHAFSPNSNWGATDGDAHFDEDEMYTHNMPTGVSFFYTAAHEIGHTLGLDHSNVPNSLMWPWGRSYTSEFVLPQDDTDAIQSIYGANPNPPTVPPTSPPPPPVFCTVSFSSVVLIRGQIYAFSDDKLWRFDTDGNLLSEPEGELSRTYFPKLPRSVSAGYERWFDGKIYFFKGRNYWVYKSARASPPLFKMYDVDSTNLPSEPDYPRLAEELNLPKKVSAALHVADEGRTYIFKAKKALIVDEFEGNMEEMKTHLAFPGGQWFPTGAFYNDGYAYLIYSHGQGADYFRFKWDQTKKTFAGMPGYPRDLYKELLHCP
ncbi:matrix metalloproteinase-9-like [Patiria miniata]|uniref:Peptidase metallopeptidase domain-containing protein n=1 Tax=Patiria miniata TaxID=46514 RepID=A0A914AP45_PATMI|nr:matrix metalloproteinase-9-like [Patiria miniata]